MVVVLSSKAGIRVTKKLDMRRRGGGRCPTTLNGNAMSILLLSRGLRRTFEHHSPVLQVGSGSGASVHR